MLPGPFVTDMSLNIMAIRMPIAGATSFYQNVQVCESQAAAISKIAGRLQASHMVHSSSLSDCHLFLYGLYHDCWRLIFLSQTASAMCTPVAAGLLAPA